MNGRKTQSTLHGEKTVPGGKCQRPKVGRKMKIFKKQKHIHKKTVVTIWQAKGGAIESQRGQIRAFSDYEKNFILSEMRNYLKAP